MSERKEAREGECRRGGLGGWVREVSMRTNDGDKVNERGNDR